MVGDVFLSQLAPGYGMTTGGKILFAYRANYFSAFHFVGIKDSALNSTSFANIFYHVSPPFRTIFEIGPPGLGWTRPVLGVT
jgi:hypothetical protein